MVSTWGALIEHIVNKQIGGKIEESFGTEVGTGGGDGIQDQTSVQNLNLEKAQNGIE